jgi:hypothetical protein
MTTTQEKVAADATKEFFVQMLTKDVSLPAAVMDLVDNCIDGALRTRGQGSLAGLTVDLRISGDEFVIKDNCGGITAKDAKRHVFRFGRPLDVEPVESSVGLFGVGMKRAMFKLGQWFEVRSVSVPDEFTVKVDVQDWLSHGEWVFPIEVVKHAEPIPESSRGTWVTVRELYPGVTQQLTGDAFKNTILEETAARHQIYLEKGLTIRINDVEVRPSSVRFAHIAQRLLPACEQIKKDGVTVKIYSGVGEGGPAARRDAGWYVYCNGRMVVRADQSELTGWGSIGAERIPKYHNQFARFRGCAFFDSLQATDLPWNTTKDGVDVEAPLFRAIRLRMAAHMRPVINFLNRLDGELDLPDEDRRVLWNMLSEAEYLPVGSLPERNGARDFYYEIPSASPRPPETTRITFDRPKAEVDQVKKCLRVRTNREVGERTFEWYLRNECR